MNTDINIGDKFLYKTHTGRGRPFVGEVVGIMVDVKNSRGEVDRVPAEELTPYEYRPYARKAKSEDGQKISRRRSS